MSIFCDWNANKSNPKGRFIMICYRITRLVRYNKILLPFFFWILPIYVFLIEWILGINFRWGVKIGKNTAVWHGQALVINSLATIGENCVLRQSTTIGNKDPRNQCPKIGNNVNIGAGVIIIGNITVGDNVYIGAGTVVVKDIPSNVVVVGNPARIVKQLL